MLSFRIGAVTLAWFGTVYAALSLLTYDAHPLLVDSLVHKAQVAGSPSVMMCSPYGVKLPGRPKFPVHEERDT